MALKISRKRKQVLVRLAEGMRQKKVLRRVGEATEASVDHLDETLQLPESVEESTEASANNLDESLQLPGPSSGTITEFDSDGDEDSDDPNYTGFSKEDAKLCYCH